MELKPIEFEVLNACVSTIQNNTPKELQLPEAKVLTTLYSQLTEDSTEMLFKLDDIIDALSLSRAEVREMESLEALITTLERMENGAANE